MCAGSDDFFIQCIDTLRHFRSAAARNFHNGCQTVQTVTRVYSFRGIPAKKILVEFEPAVALKNRNTNLLCASRVDRGLVNDDVTFLKDLSYCLACTYKWLKVRLFEIIYRRWYRHYIIICLP